MIDITVIDITVIDITVIEEAQGVLSFCISPYPWRYCCARFYPFKRIFMGAMV